MKSYWLIGGAVLLVVSLIGAFVSFTRPAESTINQSTKVLDFQQSGAFDYTVAVEPGTFYDSAPAASPEASPQIPAKFIESFSLTYNYQPAPGVTGQNLAFNAILENAGNWKKMVILKPASNQTSNITLPLDLNHFQELAAAIEKEIGSTSSSHTLTIEALASGGNGPDFVQDLPIKMTATFIKIGDNLTSSSNGSQGRFDYQVKLAENILFGPVTLNSPAPVQIVPKVVLRPGDTVFTRFIDSMKVQYSYKLTATRPINQVQADVTVEAVLDNPDKWSKTYTLVAPTEQSGDFNLSFPLEISRFSDIFDTIQKETGISANIQSLTLKATIHVTAQTAAGPIDKTFTHSIQTNLRDALLPWTGDLKKTEPGSIEALQQVTIEARVVGLPVTWIRIISVAVLVVLLLAWGTYLLAFRNKAGAVTLAEIQARQISQKYKELIVEVNVQPSFKPEQTVLPLDSLQDLIKISQGLLKPVLHNGEDGTHIYWVIDDYTRYEFRPGRASSSKEPQGGQPEV